jgi:hypothetical protein
VVDYFVGLDLGQAADYTALAVLEKTETLEAHPPRTVVRKYAVRHLGRFPLGTAYPVVVARVVALVARPPLAGCTLSVDPTGVGWPVVDLLRQARPRAAVHPILITAGHQVTRDAGVHHVPKKELVSTLQLLLQAGWLKVASALAEAPTLVHELLTFQVKVTASAHATFGSWRENAHDDLVLAAWLGERRHRLHLLVPGVVPRPIGLGLVPRPRGAW